MDILRKMKVDVDLNSSLEQQIKQQSVDHFSFEEKLKHLKTKSLKMFLESNGYHTKYLTGEYEHVSEQKVS